MGVKGPEHGGQTLRNKHKDDKQFIFKAAAEAQKAVDFIVGNTFDDAEEE